MFARSTGIAMASSPGSAAAATPAPAASRAAARRSVRIFMINPSPEQRRGRLHHLVGGTDHLGVHLVGALRGDQVAHLRNHVDIGLFEAALREGAVAFGAGETVLRRAR